MNIIEITFSILVFPGLLFLISLAFFTQYIVRKLSARYQKRMGPSYVGPYGILQPFFDFVKLLRIKEIVGTKYSMIRVAEFSLILGIAFIVSSTLLLPLSPYNLVSEFDILIFFYMTSIMPLFMLVLAALSMPNPYTNIGVSRLLSIVTIAEPAYFASLIVPVYLATRGKIPFMSISKAYAYVPSLWLQVATLVIMLLSLIAYIISIQVKAMFPPFNIPEAEQEIIAGFETEFSGPILALARLLHDLDLTIALLAGVYILLGGPAPYRHFSIEGVVVLVVKYFALLFIVVAVKNVMGRYRIEQALTQIFKYSLIPAIISSILALMI
ncbi:MAG: complex I subunit 1 family protein [Desulfurococcaceae archaeon]